MFRPLLTCVIALGLSSVGSAQLNFSFEDGLDGWEANPNVAGYSVAQSTTGATDGTMALETTVTQTGGAFGLIRNGIDTAALIEAFQADGFITFDVTTTVEGTTGLDFENFSSFAQIQFVINSDGVFRNPGGAEFIFGDNGADILFNPGTATATIPLSIFDTNPVIAFEDATFFQFFVNYNNNFASVANPFVVSIDNFRVVTPTAGDFDLDGDVDGADFLRWQRDGLSASDLEDWRNNFGTSSGSVPAFAAVPEPSALCLLTLGLSATVLQRRRRS